MNNVLGRFAALRSDCDLLFKRPKRRQKVSPLKIAILEQFGRLAMILLSLFRGNTASRG